MSARLTRQHFLRLLLGLGFAMPAALLWPGRDARAAIVAVGSVAKVKGTASLLRDGQQSILQGGEEIAAGDVVTTLADSRLRLALKDGSQLTLGELTKVTVTQFDFAQETLAREAAFDLTSGLLEAITAKVATGSSFVIRTSNAVAATRATEWIVEAKKAETSVFVLEGKVDVAASALGFRSLPSIDQDKAMLLSAGQFTTVGKISLGPTTGPKASDAKKLAALKAGLALE
jgi:hypothetical protein